MERAISATRHNFQPLYFGSYCWRRLNCSIVVRFYLLKTIYVKQSWIFPFKDPFAGSAAKHARNNKLGVCSFTDEWKVFVMNLEQLLGKELRIIFIDGEVFLLGKRLKFFCGAFLTCFFKTKRLLTMFNLYIYNYKAPQYNKADFL